jgi:membrane associated rhomboid family serine protease
VQAPRERAFNVPGIVLALIAVLGLLHVLLAYAFTAEQTYEFLLRFAFIPARYDPQVLGELSFSTGIGAAVWTFFTYAFIHADFNHLLLNLVWFVAFGAPVARRFGATRFLLFFLATSAAGALAHLVTHFGEMLPMVGASAGISGAMAGAMRFAFQRGGPLGLIRSQEDEAYRVPAAPLLTTLRDYRVLMFIVVWFGLTLLFGLGTVWMPGLDKAVAWQAHIGGFLAGLLGFSLFDPVRPASDRTEMVQTDRETTLH